MDHKKEEILKCFDKLNLEDEITINDIPSLDLYMDQVITLFETNLGKTKRYEDDKLLTKTMINNYVKDKILMGAKKKKYTKEHIILMCIIYNLKQIISIQDIKKVLEPIIKEMEKDDDENIISNEIIDIYEKFLILKKDNIQAKRNDMENIIENLEDKEDESDYKKILLIILQLINSANTQKKLAEKLIDEYFGK